MFNTKKVKDFLWITLKETNLIRNINFIIRIFNFKS